MNTKQIALVVAIVAIAAGVIVYFTELSKKAPVEKVQKISIVMDLSSDSEEQIGEIPDIIDALRLRKPLEITFSGRGTEDEFIEVFSTEDICKNIDTKEGRRQWWTAEGKAKFEAIQIAFEEWKANHKPMRYYAIGIDITEGWHGSFNLSDYLSADDLKWIKSKDFKIDIFAIGYNEVPGKRKFENIDNLEIDVNSFLSDAPQEMPQTKLLQQLNYIFDKHHYYKLVIKTDLMQNDNLSAYKYKSGDDVDLKEYFSAKSAPTTVKFIIERPITGRTSQRQAWYDVVEEQLNDIYPDTKFVFE